MSGVEIKVRADTRQARKEISNLERSIQNIDKRAERVTKAFRNAAIAITGAFAGSAVTRGITSATDSMTQLRNRVALVTKDAALTKKTISDLFQVARESRSSVDAAAETFNRFGLALQDANKPIDQLLEVTKAVNQAAIISGASSESAKAAIIQLGQGLASGQLRGQELNSVLEQTPRLAKAIAEGMKIPFGELREQAAKGLITAEAVYAAILEGADEIEKEFKSLDKTVADLSVLFGNELTRAIAELDKAVGISVGIKAALQGMTVAARAFADNFGKVTAVVAGEFQIFLTRTKFFVQDANNLFKSLFTGDFDPTAAIDSLIGRLKAAQDVAAQGTTFAIDFAIEKIDLMTAVLPNTDKALAAITQFKDNVIGIFFALWQRIVGGSLYTGIFDPMHEEQGRPSIGNTSALRMNLNKAVAAFKEGLQPIIDFFDGLYNSVLGSWKNTVDYVNTYQFSLNPESVNNLRDSFENATNDMVFFWEDVISYVNTYGFKLNPQTVNSLKDSFERMTDTIIIEWSEATAYVNTNGFRLSPEQIDFFRDHFERTMDSVVIAWDEARAHFNTYGLRFSPDQLNTLSTAFNTTLSKMTTTYDTFRNTIEAKTNVDLPYFIEIQQFFDNKLAAMEANFNTFKEAIQNTPLVIGAIKLSESFRENLGAATDQIVTFFEEDADAVALGITTALGLALNKRIRGIALKGGIAGAFAAAASVLGNDAEFLDAVRRTAKGYTDILIDIMSGEGDFVGNVVSGVANLFLAIGEGIVDAIFGEEINTPFLDTFTAALFALGAGFVLSSTIRAKFLSIGLLLSRNIFGATSALIMKTQLGNAIAEGIKGTDELPLVTTRSKRVGTKIGKMIRGSVSSAMTGAAVFAIGKTAQETLGQGESTLGDIFVNALTGGTVGAQIGAAFGPGGMVGGALVGAIGTTVAGALLSEEQRTALAELGTSIKDEFFKITDYIGDAFKRAEQVINDSVNNAVRAGIERATSFFSNIGQAAADAFMGRKTPTGEIGQLPDGTPIYAGSDGKGYAFIDKNNDGVREKYEVPLFATGGYVSGAGTATSDSIPALLSNGEYVVKASAVKTLGLGRLNLINDGKLPGYANGGLVNQFKSIGAIRAKDGVYINSPFNTAGRLMDLIAVAEARNDQVEVEKLTKALEALKIVTEDQIEAIKSGDKTSIAKAKADIEAAAARKKSIKEFEDSFKAELASGLAEALKTGDFKNMLEGFLDTLTSRVIDSFAESFIDSMLKGLDFSSMFDFMSSGFGGKQTGGFFSDVFSLFSGGSLLSFNSGGIVPNTSYSRSGVDSVPAMLTPGELVVPADKVNSFSGTTVNLSITGDISRQTRSEVIKMLPQIASGVNSQNRERNFKYA